MSTRSLIFIEKENGSYEGIYCHYDGYPEYIGALLLDYYCDRQKVEELISFGDLSVLAQNISPPNAVEHSFSKPYPNTCIFYGRDRGDKNIEKVVLNNQKEFLSYADKKIKICYVYFLDKTNQWKFFENHSHEIKNLKETLDSMIQKNGKLANNGYLGMM